MQGDFVIFFTKSVKSTLVGGVKLEARAGIEPAIELLQSPALPLGYPALRDGRLYR